MWGYIKKAINSTLGTKKFKPLNELFFLGKTVVPSGNLLFVIDDEKKEFRNPDNLYDTVEFRYNYPQTITMKTAGTIRISVDLYAGTSSTIVFRINKNGIEYSSAIANNQEEKTYVKDVPCSKGDTVSFSAYIKASGYGAYISNLRLYGDLKDISIFDIEENGVIE